MPKREVINVLIPITHEAFALSQIANYLEMRRDPSLHPILYSMLGTRLHELCRDRQISPIHIEELVLEEPRCRPTSKPKMVVALSRLGKIFSGVFSRQYPSYANLLRSLWTNFCDQRKKIRAVEAFCKKKGVHAVCLTETSPAYDSPIFFRVTRKLKLPLFTITYSMDSPESYAEIYKSSESLVVNKRSKKIVAALLPKWAIVHENKKILRLSIAEIVTHEVLRMSSPNPWQTVGGMNEFVLAESMGMKDFYSQYVGDQKKIEVTGSGRLDTLARAISRQDEIKHKVAHSKHIDLDKKIILCCLPQTHWVCGRTEAEFQDHHQMVKSWIAVLSSQKNFTVICSLHPSMKYEDFQQYENEKCRIVQIPTVDLIAICDVFVSCLSSLTPLAIAAGKAVIGYDVYRYSDVSPYLKYETAKGTVTVRELKEFRGVIERIDSEAAYLEELSLRQSQSSAYWGNLDGNSGSHMSKAIKSRIGPNLKGATRHEIACYHNG